MPEELMKPPPTPYLTVIEGRLPKQKVHKRIGDAKNAFDTPKRNKNFKGHYAGAKQHMYAVYTHSWGQLYEMVDGEWVLRYDVPQPSVQTDEYPYYVDTRPWKSGA